MYQYDDYDRRIVEERASQFRDQVERRVAGTLTEEEFRPLRLQNGLYLQLHGYMLRIAIPYGLLSSKQLRMLAHVTRTYDRGYAHFTTRQNLQLNWPKLADVPAILDALASVDMHAIQTSGNCVRNITSDPFAGVARDEEIDPRPYCELLRQWSTFHPEFAHLPRKFKIAITGAPNDRAAIAVHDIGLRVTKNEAGEIGFVFYVGGGQGRTPVLAELLHPFVPERALIAYTEAVLRVYNQLGRRDNIYKARIKILVKETGLEAFKALVEAEFARIQGDAEFAFEVREIERIAKHFATPGYTASKGTRDGLLLGKDRDLARFVEGNVLAHREPGYGIVQLSLKSADLPPGDVTADQMDAVAELADRFSMGRIVVTHRQNLVLTDVRLDDLAALHEELIRLGLASPNVSRLTDIVACPGLDYCDLANARSIPIAMQLQKAFADLDRVFDLGEVTLNISGCINACGHHHVGNIGILGIDKLGEEFYQLTVGGNHTEDAAIGKILGRAFAFDEIVPAVERLLTAYAELRVDKEPFLNTLRRVGTGPFKEAVYGTHSA
jgi:sulfite reductase (NADPH) hemoprotein beta-component